MEFPNLGGAQARLFGEVADRYLVWATDKLGWGQWEALAENVLVEPSLCFNFYARSRTPNELRKRVEVLARSVEKELAKPLKRERERERKRKEAEEDAFMAHLRKLLPKPHPKPGAKAKAAKKRKGRR
eukprot:COSAG05_NODE_3217_length_2230_cov_1.925387_2_plen_128_part_00